MITPRLDAGVVIFILVTSPAKPASYHQINNEFSYFFTKKLVKISQSSKNLAYYTCKKNIYRR